MPFHFTAMQTLSRHFLILKRPLDAELAPIAERLLGKASGVRAEGAVFYECESLPNGAKLFGAEYYTEKNGRLPLPADGVRVLGAYLRRRDQALPPNLRILSDGEIKSVDKKDDSSSLFTVYLPPPSFDAHSVGLTAGHPLLGQKIPIGGSTYPIYALSFGQSSFAVCFRFGQRLFDLRPSSIALPLSLMHVFSRPFETVFAEITGESSLSMRSFCEEHGELDASSEGAAAAISIAHLLGFLPIGQELSVKMRGGELLVRADYLGAPISVTAETHFCFDGTIDL